MEVRSGYKQTDLGVVPDDWHVCELDKVTQLQVGYAFKSEWFGRYGELRLLRGENVGYGSVDWSDTRTLDISKRTEFSHYLLSGGDIIIGMDRTFTKSGVKISRLTNKDISSLLVQRVGRFIPTRCNADFLWHVLSFSRFHAALKLEQTGMDIPHLSRMEILHPIIAVPPLPEQQAIANALNDVDDLIASLDRLIAKKRDIKQAAMQQLLTGKTRLKGFSGEWETKRLGTVISIRNEKVNTLGSEIAAFCIELEQIGQNSGQIDGHSDARGRQTMKYRFERGDVLFGRLRPYLRKYWLAEREGVCSTEIWPLVTINEQLARDFLFQTVQSDAFIDAANSSYGTHMPRSDWKALTQFEFLVPRDIAEQQAIGQLLCDMDAEMKELQRRRDKSIEIKQGMMQELLTGRTRLI